MCTAVYLYTCAACVILQVYSCACAQLYMCTTVYVYNYVTVHMYIQLYMCIVSCTRIQLYGTAQDIEMRVALAPLDERA